MRGDFVQDKEQDYFRKDTAKTKEGFSPRLNEFKHGKIFFFHN